MSQLNVILQDIQTLLASNAGGVKAYRADYVPTELEGKRDTGYIEWDFELDKFEQNSCEYTGNVFGNLTATSWAVTRSIRDAVYEDVLDLLMPATNGYRKQVAPRDLGSCYLHYADLVDIREFALELEGHQSPETAGIYASFNLKLSYLTA